MLFSSSSFPPIPQQQKRQLSCTLIVRTAPARKRSFAPSSPKAGQGKQLSLDNVRRTNFPISTACTLDLARLHLRLPRRKKETGLDPRLYHAHKLWVSSFFVKMSHVFSLSMFLELIIHQREISLCRDFFEESEFAVAMPIIPSGWLVLFLNKNGCTMHLSRDFEHIFFDDLA